jgi:hypothetical protein
MMYEGVPGNEAIVPTKHDYVLISESSADYLEVRRQRGVIDCRQLETIHVTEVA